MPALGWERAYRSGDLVRHDHEGWSSWARRRPGQARRSAHRAREIDNALLTLPGVTGAAAAVRTTRSGNRILVGYLATDRRSTPRRPRRSLRDHDARTPRAAPRASRRCRPGPRARSTGTLCPGRAPTSDLGAASSCTAPRPGCRSCGRSPRSGREPTRTRLLRPRRQQSHRSPLVSRLRAAFPEVTVADVYESPRSAPWPRRSTPWTPPRRANRTGLPRPASRRRSARSSSRFRSAP